MRYEIEHIGPISLNRSASRNWLDLTREISTFLGFCCLALVLRAPSFTRSVIDWDESLYFLMAEAWRAGHLPYTTIFDNKPIGIYSIFAAFQYVFGDTVLSIRIAAVVAVTATAFLVYKITEYALTDVTQSWRTFAVTAGAIYVIASISNDGMSSNTEIFVSPFTCLAIYIALIRRPSLSLCVLVGFIFGCACLIKPVALFEGAALLFILIWNEVRRIEIKTQEAGSQESGRARRSARVKFLSGVIKVTAALMAGALLPVALVAMWFWRKGQFDLLIVTNIAANLRRAGEPISWLAAMRGMSDQLLVAPLYLGAILFAVYTFRRSAVPIKRLISTAFIIWTIGAFVGALSANAFYSHYFLQPLPVLCIMTICILARILTGIGKHEAQRSREIALLSFVALGLLSGAAATDKDILKPALGAQNQGIGWLRDPPAQVAAAILPELATNPGATIFVFDYEPIIYSLTHVTPPTRYLGSFLIDRRASDLARINATEEIENILSKHPLFIIRDSNLDGPADPAYRNDNVYRVVDGYLAAHYNVFERFPDALVYARR